MRNARDIVQAQTDGLIAELKRYEAERVGACLEDARQRAAAIVSAAHERARKRMRAAVQEERKRAAQRERMRSMQAAHDERLARQRETQRLLSGSRALVEEALRQRWQDPGARARWWRAAIERAAEAFLGKEWIIELPASLDDRGELADIEKLLEARGVSATLDVAGDLEAGLRVRCEDVLMDAGIEGLLAHGEQIDALLLALLDAPAGARAPRSGS